MNYQQGVANRGASIRVGRDTEKEGKGYFEDRRPASNMDPYVVTSMIAETTILWKPWAPQLLSWLKTRKNKEEEDENSVAFHVLTLDTGNLSGHF